MNRRVLVRLFPRNWRQRYGEEFAALLESTDITSSVVVDVATRAAGVWIATTLTGRLILGAALATTATAVAIVLTIAFPVGPIVVLENGHEFASAPWPTGLSVFFGLLSMSFGIRTLAFVATGARAGVREQRWWLVAFFAASALAQWGQMVAHLGTGGAPSPILLIWGISAVFLAVDSLYVLMLSSNFSPALAGSLRPKSPPSRPLGLS